MATENKVEITLKAKDEMSPIVDKVADNTQSQFERMKSFINDHWRAIAMTLAGIAASITAAFYSVTQAAAAQEDAQNDLVSAMTRLGTYSPTASKMLLDYANAMQLVTRYEDDAIVAAEAILVNHGMTTNEVRKATQATLDLAAAKKIDLKTAAELIGKAFEGETSTLTRYGIVLGDNIPKTEKFAAVLDLVNERFGGAAQQDANTYSGQIAKLKNAYDELKEAIGGVIIKSDVMNSGIGMLKSFIEGLTKFIEEHQTVTKIILIAGAITAVAGALGTLALILAKVAPIIAGLGGAAALAALIAAAPAVGTAVGGLAIGGGIGYGINYLTGVNGAIADADQARQEAEAEQKELLVKFQAKQAKQASMSAGGPSDQVFISQSLQEIQANPENDEISARIAKLEREKELHQMGYSSESDRKNYLIGEQQFKEASSNSLQNQFNQQEEEDYQAWVTEQEEKQRIQLENFDVIKTKAGEFYSWMEDRSKEAASATQSNFSSYFFDMFTGKIRNLKDLWMGFCNSIWNAWAQTMANMAAQKVTSSLFGSLFGTPITAGWSPEKLTFENMQGIANSPFIMAEGGVLNRPTFTLAGESGPEAVVPLSRGRAIPVEMRGGGGSSQAAQHVTININNPLDGDSVKRMLAKERDTIVSIFVRDYNDRGQTRSIIQDRR